jgi:DNA-directed RNA polymerase subunit K/omega
MSTQEGQTSLEEVSDAELEKQISNPSHPILLSGDDDSSVEEPESPHLGDDVSVDDDLSSISDMGPMDLEEDEEDEGNTPSVDEGDEGAAEKDMRAFVTDHEGQPIDEWSDKMYKLLEAYQLSDSEALRLYNVGLSLAKKETGGEEEKGEGEEGEMIIKSMLEQDPEEELTDSDTEEEYFQKLESDINTDQLIAFHPELLQSNYQEIKTMCKITRNKKGIIIDPLHTTIPFLTKYEKARILGVRSKQLNNNADPFVDVPPNMISGLLIAEEELKQKKMPFIVRRPLPNGGSEYWRVEDLEIIEY